MSTRGVTLGSSHAAPPATARAAAMRSSALASLSTNPAAPASRAPHRASSSSNVVSTSTGGLDPPSLNARVAVTPSIRRIRTSISTRSGACSATAEATSSPSPHSATTSKPSSGPRMRAIPLRTTGWSSTTMTLIMTRSAGCSACRGAGGGRRLASRRPSPWPRGCRRGRGLARPFRSSRSGRRSDLAAQLDVHGRRR